MHRQVASKIAISRIMIILLYSRLPNRMHLDYNLVEEGWFDLLGKMMMTMIKALIRPVSFAIFKLWGGNKLVWSLFAIRLLLSLKKTLSVYYLLLCHPFPSKERAELKGLLKLENWAGSEFDNGNDYYDNGDVVIVIVLWWWFMNWSMISPLSLNELVAVLWSQFLVLNLFLIPKEKNQVRQCKAIYLLI